METRLDHVEIRVKLANLAFYGDLLGFLGWKTLYQAENMHGLGGSNGASLWFTTEVNDAKNDYDGVGTNHIGIHTNSQADVDATVEYIKGIGVAGLFETPRHRPEFTQSETETYYQVMFESPDKVLFEVVYTGPKQ